MSKTVPFPPLPEWLPIESADRPVSLRSFGSDLSDLVVDFQGARRPWLVTSLLAGCSQTRDGSPTREPAIWDLPVSTRIEAVVALAATSSGGQLEWEVRCGYPDCGADSELGLSPGEIETLAAEASRDKLVPAAIGARTAVLRRPTGADQRRWLESGAQGLAPLAASLLVDPSLEDLEKQGVPLDEIEAAIDRAMEVFDPLVGFRVDVGCPECGRPTAHVPDLTSCALGRLWQVQGELIEQVHRLALHYHWTEEEIAKVPAWRRQAYLARIDGGEL